jgi:hypothetical protein
MISTSGTLIEGNRIGSDRSGTTVLGNNGTAIEFDTDMSAPTSSIRPAIAGGGVLAPLGTKTNPIALNSLSDIAVFSVPYIAIVNGMLREGSFIKHNDEILLLYNINNIEYRGPSLSQSKPKVVADAIVGLPTVIDIGDDGVTPNDAGDLDGIQNYPVLASAATVDGQTTIQGSLNSLANTSFQLEFYSNLALVQSGGGPGEQSLGLLTVTTDAQGNASFTFHSPVPVPVGRFITALATRLQAGASRPSIPPNSVPGSW